VAVTNGVGITIPAGAGRGDTKDTAYPVIGLATFAGFAVQLRFMIPDAPRSAVTFGAPGRGYAVNSTESLCPAAFIATTVYMVFTAFLMPMTVNDLSLGPARFGFLLSGIQITL